MPVSTIKLVVIVCLPVFEKIGTEYQIRPINVIVPDQVNGDFGYQIRLATDLHSIIGRNFSGV